jgi:hypothetical protein
MGKKCVAPAHNFRLIQQYSKPIIAIFTITIVILSIFVASFFAFGNFVTTQLAVQQSLPQTTSEPYPSTNIQTNQTASTAPTTIPTTTPKPTPKTTNTPQSTGTTTLSQGSNDEEVYSVVQSSDGSNALAGYTKSYGSGGSDMFLVKTEPRVMNGLPNNPTMNAVIWAKTYGGIQDDGAKSLVLSSDGGYLLAGYTKSLGAGGSDMFLLKTDANGNPQWNMTYGGSQDDGANSLVQANDGGYVLAGYSNSNLDSQSTWIVKVDVSGNLQWNTVCGGKGATSISKTNDGGYVISVDQPNAYGIIKIDSEGQIQWSQTYPVSSYNARAQSTIQTSDGGYAIAGWVIDQAGNNSTWLLKTDSAGVLQWSQTYAGLGAYCIIQTARGGYAMTGDRAFLLVTDSAGNVLWNRNYDALSDPSMAFTRGYALIQPSADYYVIAMVQASYGQIPRGLQTYVVSITISLPP